MSLPIFQITPWIIDQFYTSKLHCTKFCFQHACPSAWNKRLQATTLWNRSLILCNYLLVGLYCRAGCDHYFCTCLSVFPGTTLVVLMGANICIKRSLSSCSICLCVCVCLSVCLSVRHEPVLCLNGVRYSHSYYTYRRWISRKWYMLRATVTQEVIPLMNGTTFDDLAWFLTSASRSQYTSKVNISKPVHATDKLLRDTNRKPYPSYRMVPWPWLTPWPTFQVRSPKANHAGLSATAHLLVNLH